ncbi:hypothetical protein B0H34DRAFT_738145 [Crassisporium funariophilum]|nr:hypothetical protein B0H34DRAFT_738145 [Crassisporium funariophilum]
MMQNIPLRFHQDCQPWPNNFGVATLIPPGPPLQWPFFRTAVPQSPIERIHADLWKITGIPLMNDRDLRATLRTIGITLVNRGSMPIVHDIQHASLLKRRPPPSSRPDRLLSKQRSDVPHIAYPQEPTLLKPGTIPPNYGNSDELLLKINGDQGYLNWSHVKPSIVRFLASRRQQVSNSLVIEWPKGSIDKWEQRGMITLATLFSYLDEPEVYMKCIPMYHFTRMKVSVPETMKDLIARNGLIVSFAGLEGFDFKHASNLLEFFWKGDFGIFRATFVHLPFERFTVINFTKCHMSVDDALRLLHSCPNVHEVVLETIRSNDDEKLEDCYAGPALVKPRHTSTASPLVLHNLKYLTIMTTTSFAAILHQIRFRNLAYVDLTSSAEHAVNVSKLLFSWRALNTFKLNCRLTEQELFHLRVKRPNLEFHGSVECL